MKNLTTYERLQLCNQFAILSYLTKDKDLQNEYTEKINILKNGFKYKYSEIFEDMKEELSEEDSEFVYDVLDLYRSLNLSYQELKIEDEELKEKIRFKWFDHKYEAEMIRFADFIMSKGIQFPEVLENSSTDKSSHCRTKNRYSKMIEKWKSYGYGSYLNLSRGQIEEILSIY